MNWYSKEADKTYIALGGLIIGLIVVVGLFILHNADDQKDLLSGEHIMAIIGMPTLILTYAVGHKHGQESKENGNTKKEGDAPDANQEEH